MNAYRIGRDEKFGHPTDAYWIEQWQIHDELHASAKALMPPYEIISSLVELLGDKIPIEDWPAGMQTHYHNWMQAREKNFQAGQIFNAYEAAWDKAREVYNRD